MKSRDVCLGLAGAFTLFLVGCGGGDGADGIIGTGFNISGAVEKGPFVIGSTVTINVLNGAGDSTAETLVEQTKDNLGHFSFSYNQRKTVRITAQGYHFNEISGKLSNSVLTLRGIYEISDSAQQTAYVNILTHLTSERVVKHIKNGLATSDAINTAQTEFLDAFRTVINVGELPPFSKLSIYDVNTDTRTGNAYLLALSSIIYQYATNRSQSNVSSVDSELTLALNKLASDFADDGRFAQLDLIGNLVTASRLVRPDVITQNLILRSSEVLGTSLDAANLNLFLDTDGDGVNNTLDTDDDNDDVLDLEDTTPYTYSPNNAPIAASTQITLDEDTSANLSLAIQSKKPDALSFYLVMAPTNGSLEGAFPNLRYRPKANFNGNDRIEYKISNGVEDSSVAYVDITVRSINDAPTISGNPINSFRTGPLYSFTPSASDIDYDSVTFSVENLPTWASFDKNNGRLQGTPSNNDTGIYSGIKMTISDGKLTAALDTFSIEVLPNPWSTKASPPSFRVYPALASWDSKIYATGGKDALNGGALRTFEVYDARTNEWASKPNMLTARSYHASVTVNGRLYVIGGNNTYWVPTQSTEAYDFQQDAWSTVTPLTIPRAKHSSCVYGGKIFAFGGWDSTNNSAVASVEMYDPEANTWTPRAAMSRENFDMQCVTVNDRVFVIGGGYNDDRYEVYDPLLDRWEEGGSLSIPRTHGFAAAVLGGNIYLFGDPWCSFAKNCDPNRVDLFDIAKLTWKTIHPMPATMYEGVYGQIIDGAFYITGLLNDQRNKTLVAYDPSLDW